MIYMYVSNIKPFMDVIAFKILLLTTVLIFSDQEKSSPIFLVKPQSKSVKTYPGHWVTYIFFPFCL